MSSNIPKQNFQIASDLKMNMAISIDETVFGTEKIDGHTLFYLSPNGGITKEIYDMGSGNYLGRIEKIDPNSIKKICAYSIYPANSNFEARICSISSCMKIDDKRKYFGAMQGNPFRFLVEFTYSSDFFKN